MKWNTNIYTLFLYLVSLCHAFVCRNPIATSIYDEGIRVYARMTGKLAEFSPQLCQSERAVLKVSIMKTNLKEHCCRTMDLKLAVRNSATYPGKRQYLSNLSLRYPWIWWSCCSADDRKKTFLTCRLYKILTSTTC